MSFNGNFIVSQGTNPSQFTITDTSTGSDSNLSGRTIQIYQIDGTLLGGSSINWPIGNGPLTLSFLTVDVSLNFLVTWSSISPLPSPSTYVKNYIVTFVTYTNNFIYSLIKQLTAQPSIVNDTQFFGNLSKIQTFVDSAIQATDYNDQQSAQVFLNMAQSMILNQNLYF
jgi:hypothetical protein